MTRGILYHSDVVSDFLVSGFTGLCTKLHATNHRLIQIVCECFHLLQVPVAAIGAWLEYFDFVNQLGSSVRRPRVMWVGPATHTCIDRVTAAEQFTGRKCMLCGDKAQASRYLLQNTESCNHGTESVLHTGKTSSTKSHRDCGSRSSLCLPVCVSVSGRLNIAI